MAGRDRAKLEATRAELAKKLPAAADVPILDADINDLASLDKMLASTKAVLTLAGPYAKVGGPLVASAVRSKTHYCDITGVCPVPVPCSAHAETRLQAPWARVRTPRHPLYGGADARPPQESRSSCSRTSSSTTPLPAPTVRSRLSHSPLRSQSHSSLTAPHAPLLRSGTCVVSACGYDSVPWDLGAMLAVRQLRERGVTGGVSVAGYVGATAGGFSGGTVASLLGALDDPTARALSGSHSLDLEWAPRPDAGPQLAPRYSQPGRRWTVPSIMAAVNEKVVNRSAALKPDTYGSRGDFEYKEATLVPNAIGAAIGGALMATAGLLIALPPTRWLLMKARASPPAATLRLLV